MADREFSACMLNELGELEELDMDVLNEYCFPQGVTLALSVLILISLLLRLKDRVNIQS